eukprot:CAMPEP_0172367440 /NCGR_PEP_ID=MMETSP1060-20121228/21354_1 /TAXON_ID=37318 /ORGANISM="Pseudo-nitzschia pungens, Strain cf. cingulata" /LENGTH=655 /DNA_ID=CAMNT_0013091675 /DNA_START=97 /DNA_END=2061 /DNA_ORIENTATION=+
MTNCNMFLRMVASTLFLLIMGSSAENHRIFPAAQIESYNTDNSTPLLGVVSSSNISFAISCAHSDQQRTDTDTDTQRNKRNASDKVNDFLQPAILRFKKSLTRFPDFTEDYSVNPSNLSLRPLSKIEIVVESSNVSLYYAVPEDYNISITTDSSMGHGDHEDDDDFRNSNEGGVVVVTLGASTVFGVLRALETLGQLLEFGWMENGQDRTNLPNNNNNNNDGTSNDASIGVFYVQDIPLFISDEPSFSFRGLMIDTARHYLPLNLILDTLDAMEMNKLNVLHWHLTDQPSFPYRSTNMPELAEKGAFHPKRIYTVEDVRTVIRQAYLRGIRVIPEIDMPGHTNAIAKSHPEVMSHCKEASEPMNPTVPETYEFVEAIYRDLSDVFPDEYVHVGGDEVELSNWLEDPSIVEWMKAHGMNETVELYEYFETRLLQIVANFEKTPIVWQEVFNLNLTITPNTIVDVWKGFDASTLQNATNQNYRVILSGCWYLDWLQPWETYYHCEPRNFTSANPDLLIGGHASMWGEHVDASNFVSKVWPKASAVAERLWHGNVTASGAADTVADRIHLFRCRMVLQGIAAEPAGPGVCPTEVGYQSRRLRACSASHSENLATEEEPLRDDRAGETASVGVSSIETKTMETPGIEGRNGNEKSSWLR